MQTLNVAFQPAPVQYELIIGENLLQEALSYAKQIGFQSIVITTKGVYDFLPSFREEKIVLSQGEGIKTRSVKEKIEDGLIERGWGRETCLIAIGGGALIDLVGFVAATYCRGIPYLTVPTTLLSMSDGVVGGKTAVNVEEAKNWIGAFHHPQRVYIDLLLLKSLPPREFAYGLSEAIKHSLVADSQFFNFLELHLDAILQRDLSLVQEMIFRSCSIKKTIVEQDPYEKQGLRRILSFGHTIGHALETLSDYTLGHGQAIALGLMIETAISHRMGYLSHSVVERVEALLKRLPSWQPFPPRLPYEMLKRDKKGAHRMVILTGIGSVAPFDGDYVTYLTEDMFYAGWKDVVCAH